MKIGLILLTDLHIQDAGNPFNSRVASLVDAVRNEFDESQKVYIVISGDIANKGKGFKTADAILSRLKTSLERFLKDKPIQFVIVPGNHDCDFSESNQVRDIVIDLIPNTSIDEGSTIIETCLSVQNNFWTFYGQMIGNVPENKLFFQIKDQIEDKIICFNCYNTAWMSSINENVGKMFFPLNQIPTNTNFNSNTFNISILHHPLNWFTPNTEPNNKKEFTSHLEKTSQIIILGHEHEDEISKKQNVNNQNETIYVSGKPLQGENAQSGFKCMEIDVINKKGTVKEFRYAKSSSIYQCKEDKEIVFEINHVKNTEKDFLPKREFLDYINSLNLPLKFESRKNVKLSEIYVYPDLEKISSKEKKIDEYYSAKKLLQEGKNVVVLEGELQSGKTSLLNMLYLDYFERDVYPLLISADKLMKNDYNKYLKKAYEEQYNISVADYEVFKQYNKTKKILLIDDLQEYTYNGATLTKCLNELLQTYNKIIIATTSIYAHTASLNSAIGNIDYFLIQALGYKKRNELIEKYHLLNESPQTVTDQVILEKTKYHFDQIQSVLGNRLIPSYPVYILSILQTLIYTTNHNLEQTSLGYCYQSLLYLALSEKANINNEDIDSYFNFLSELAFNLYELNLTSFSADYLDEFYRNYSNKYVSKNLTKIKDKLLVSNILVEIEENEYKFRYTYIFYFLISKKLSEILNTDKGKEIISTLCNNLSDEKACNVLIFTAHHTKDNYLIDEATFSLMTPYESYLPVTLDRDDIYYEQIEAIVKEISSNIIESDKNPNEERTKALEASDNFQKIKTKEEEAEEIEREKEEYTQMVEEMTHAIKALEIVGQIVKNRKGSIDKTKLISIVKELYNTAFRTITFFGEISKLTVDEVMNTLREKIHEDDSQLVIENKIKMFFQYMTFQHCLSIFCKIIYSVGNKDLKEVFDQVAKELGTPAAKVVTFSIKSCYGKVSPKELKTLANEFKNNPVVLSILRSRVRSYIYNNHVSYKEKQQLANSLQMKILG